MPALLCILLCAAFVAVTLNFLVQRIVYVWLALLALLLSGCAFTITPSFPRGGRICYPAKSWRCHPYIEWAEMSISPRGMEANYGGTD